MATRPSFADEVVNVLYATEGSPLHACIQCGTCAASCPAAPFMDHSPRELIAMIRLGLKKQVLASNAFWTCASCYQCTVRCPKGIDIAYMMYGLKRYTLWRNKVPRGVLGADFSRRFVKMILKYGRSFEPELAVPYVFRHGLRGLLDEAFVALGLLRKRRLPLAPSRVKDAERLRRVLMRIVPVGRVA